jgi:hypothetical protein
MFDEYNKCLNEKTKLNSENIQDFFENYKKG